jgi:hypothetical protein
VLRGLDASAAARSDDEPPIVRIAGREPLPGTVTVYVDEGPSRSCRRRFDRALAQVDLLAEAGLVRSAQAVAWPASGTPRDDAASALRSLLRSFVAAAGRDALEPFYGLDAGAVSVPDLAITVRRSGTVTDLYPRRTPDGDLTVETALERLVAGGALEELGRSDAVDAAGGVGGRIDGASTRGRRPSGHRRGAPPPGTAR